MRVLVYLIAFHLTSNLLSAQMYNGGALYIHDGVSVYVSSGTYYFAPSGASTVTSRSSNPGVLAFGPGVTTSGVSTTHYVDGYAATYGSAAFELPVGQSGVYAPVKVVPSGTLSTRGAYYQATPALIGSALASTVASITTQEYWHLVGVNPTVVSLSWRSASNVSALVGGNLDRLTLVGWNGSSWNEIASSVDTTAFTGGTSTLTSGSITSTSSVDLTVYSYFTLGVKNPLCLPQVMGSGITRTWNGTWDGSVPTLADAVVINAPYSGSLSCQSLVLNADLTLADGELLDIVHGVSGTGKVIMSSEASLVQRDDAASAPTIQLTKVTNPMRRLDYVFLSSPLTNASTFMSDLANKAKTAVNGNYNAYPASAFYYYQTYNSAGTAYIIANGTNILPGKGFSAAVASQSPYSTATAAGSWFTEKYPIHIKTQGVTNNGNITVSVPANGWVFLGNPYPSALSGEKLLDAVGTSMRKTLYFWTFTTPRANWNNSGSNYNNADFATWNYAGGVAACATCPVPTGSIASMQSVLMRGIVPTSTTLTLTNCMRETTGNDMFFRVQPSDRYWLNLTGTTGSFCQTLVAYSPDATMGEDSGYDSLKLSGSTSAVLTSLIGTTKYAIQTRSDFEVSDAVPLQVERPTSETLTISLGTKEGIFASGTVGIYLHDKTLGVYHDLATGPYTFLQTEASNAERFEVVYQPQLSNPTSGTLVNALSYIADAQFHAQANEPMESIQIYDLNGRLVAHYKGLHSQLTQQPFQHAQGVYLVKIHLQNGLVFEQKLLNY